MIVSVLAVAASLIGEPGGVRCATWTDLRQHPPAAAVVEAWVRGDVIAFDTDLIKAGRAPLDPNVVLQKIDVDCEKHGELAVTDMLVIEEEAYKLRPTNPPPSN